MKSKYLLLIISLTIGFTINAQSSTQKNPKTLQSIYTFSNFVNSTNSFSNLNKKLSLKNLQFGFVGHFNPDFNPFPLYFEDLSKTPTDFDYDYKRFQDRNLNKVFLIENNPFRRNLNCPNPLSFQTTK